MILRVCQQGNFILPKLHKNTFFKNQKTEIGLWTNKKIPLAVPQIMMATRKKCVQKGHERGLKPIMPPRVYDGNSKIMHPKGVRKRVETDRTNPQKYIYVYILLA